MSSKARVGFGNMKNCTFQVYCHNGSVMAVVYRGFLLLAEGTDVRSKMLRTVVLTADI
jgi:hypothetical protein